MLDAETNLSLIHAVRAASDSTRWGEFHSIYRPLLVAYLRRQGVNEWEADEIAQDVFVKLISKLHTYDRQKCRFRNWLYSVAHNTLVDHARRRAALQKAMEGWVGVMLSPNPSDDQRMEAEWVKMHRKKILAHALRKVRARTSVQTWACFEQRVIRDRPGSEIAESLGITANSVFVNASRVLKQIRAECLEYDEELSDGFEQGMS